MYTYAGQVELNQTNILSAKDKLWFLFMKYSVVDICNALESF